MRSIFRGKARVQAAPPPFKFAARCGCAGRNFAVRGALPETTSASLVAQLLRHGGEDDKAAARAEQKLLLQEALDAFDPIDREVLTLRHCEQLSNDATADVLGVSKGQASESYIPALKRIAVILRPLPGFKARR